MGSAPSSRRDRVYEQEGDCRGEASPQANESVIARGPPFEQLAEALDAQEGRGQTSDLINA